MRARAGCLMTLLVLAAVGAACGSDDGSGVAGSAPTAPTPTASTPGSESSPDSTAEQGPETTDDDSGAGTSSPTTEITTSTTAQPREATFESTAPGEWTISFDHPTWGRARLITRQATPDDSTLGPASMTVLDESGAEVYSYHNDGMYSFRPAGSTADALLDPFDALGHIFIDFNPGRYNGLIVLKPTPDGFADFETLPPSDGYSTRFYGARVIDDDGDGTYEVEVTNYDCVPTCAGGSATTTIYRWSGSDYVADAAPPASDTSAAARTERVEQATGVDTASYPGWGEDGSSVAFTSPSGNVLCVWYDSIAGIDCWVKERDTLPPERDCGEITWFPNYVGLGESETYDGVCTGGVMTPDTATTLPYGSALRFANRGCLSEESGITCVDFGSGLGFEVNRSAFNPFGP